MCTNLFNQISHIRARANKIIVNIYIYARCVRKREERYNALMINFGIIICTMIVRL